jgi:hypothetical protein
MWTVSVCCLAWTSLKKAYIQSCMLGSAGHDIGLAKNPWQHKIWMLPMEIMSSQQKRPSMSVGDYLWCCGLFVELWHPRVELPQVGWLQYQLHSCSHCPIVPWWESMSIVIQIGAGLGAQSGCCWQSHWDSGRCWYSYQCWCSTHRACSHTVMGVARCQTWSVGS